MNNDRLNFRTPYWNKKFAGGEHVLVPAALFMPMKFEQKTEYKTVIFHKGYTNETMEFEIKSIGITNEPNDLNLPCCWEIKQGDNLNDLGILSGIHR